MSEKNMPRLILIRHSNPNQIHDVNSHYWELSEKGRANCQPLAEKLRPHDIQRMITSDEPKAMQTGQLVAEYLDIPVETAPDLYEQKRYTVGWFNSIEERTAAVRKLFEQPDEVVFGEESGIDAYQRFAQAIDSIHSQYPDENLGIATHGTVMALFLERRAGVNAIEFWQQMGIPMFVVLEPTENGNFEVISIVRDVHAE